MSAPAALPLGPDDRPLCGTDSGYYAHRRTFKERACWKCCGAHADAEHARYERDPEKHRTRAREGARRRKQERQEVAA